jgi:hypothetical protein
MRMCVGDGTVPNPPIREHIKQAYHCHSSDISPGLPSSKYPQKAQRAATPPIPHRPGCRPSLPGHQVPPADVQYMFNKLRICSRQMFPRAAARLSGAPGGGGADERTSASESGDGAPALICRHPGARRDCTVHAHAVGYVAEAARVRRGFGRRLASTTPPRPLAVGTSRSRDMRACGATPRPTRRGRRHRAAGTCGAIPIPPWPDRRDRLDMAGQDAGGAGGAHALGSACEDSSRRWWWRRTLAGSLANLVPAQQVCVSLP